MQLGYDIFTESQDFLGYFIQSNVCILYGYMATWRRISQLLFSATAPNIFGTWKRGSCSDRNGCGYSCHHRSIRGLLKISIWLLEHTETWKKLCLAQNVDLDSENQYWGYFILHFIKQCMAYFDNKKNFKLGCSGSNNYTSFKRIGGGKTLSLSHFWWRIIVGCLKILKTEVEHIWISPPLPPPKKSIPEQFRGFPAVESK